VIDDVNRLCLRSYALDDALDPQKAHAIAEQYLRIWCASSNQYSFESAARIWVGGPDGWWQLSSLPYWKKVKQEMLRRGLNPGIDLLDNEPKFRLTPVRPSGFTVFAISTTPRSSTQTDLIVTLHLALNGGK
jgi:hypothetical protein